MHDVAEDTSISLDLIAQTCGLSITQNLALRLLTHDPSVPYLEYIYAIATDPLATAVKLHDLADNMDLSALGYTGIADPSLPEKLLARMRKYTQAVMILRGDTDEKIRAYLATFDRNMIAIRSRA